MIYFKHEVIDIIEQYLIRATPNDRRSFLGELKVICDRELANADAKAAEEMASLSWNEKDPTAEQLRS